MSSSTKETQQTQSSQTAPWERAMPLVNSLLGQYGNMSTGVTGDQSSALAGLKNSLSNLPNFGASGADAISKLFASDSSPQVGLLQNAYGNLQTNLGATASGANLNPYDTPGFKDALQTAINDTTNQVKGVYAGSGRDPSGAGSFAQSLGRGITQGISPTIANQYNANVGNMNAANSALFSGAGSTASGITNLRQSDFTNMLAGLQGAGALPGLYAGPATAQLGAANAAYSQPYQNLAQLLQPSVALAGLGSTSSGQGTSTQTSNPSWIDTISGGMGVLGKGASTVGAILPFLGLSDRRAKTDIAKVGKLNDGSDVYSFRYRGSPKTEIGLMAQDVEKRDPEAVVEIGGLKHVNYARALAPSARVGKLLEAA